MTQAPGRASYRSLFAVREFRTLCGAQVVSYLGDDLAGLALSVLTFDRTRSPLLTALVFALTFLPVLVAGPLLGGLADRRPRRQVMVAADLARAGLVGVMAVPQLPLPLLVVILVVVTSLQAPFSACRTALLPDVLPDRDRYLLGSSIERTIEASAQVLGYAVGGLVIVALDPDAALTLDAVTFLVSACLLHRGLALRPAVVPHEPAAAGAGTGQRWNRAVADARTGLHAVFARAATRKPVLITWAGLLCVMVPEGLAVPYATHLGAGARAVGLLLAANPVGNVAASLTLARLPAGRRDRLVNPLLVLALLPLVGCLLDPTLPVVLILLVASGAGTSYSMLARAEFADAVAPEARGRAFAIAGTGVTVVQGLGIAVAGGLAELIGVQTVVATAGLTGLVMVTLTLANPGARPRPGRVRGSLRYYARKLTNPYRQTRGQRTPS